MHLTGREAEAILRKAHLAWTEGDIDGTLACYSDDLTYVCNTGAVDGGPLTISGKPQFRDFLLPVMETVASWTAVSQFKFDGQIGRALIECHLHHRKTGLSLVGTYSQIATFKRGMLSRMEELHDVSRMVSFWRLVLSEEEEPTSSIFRMPAGSRSELSWREQLPPNWHRPKPTS